MGDPCVGDEGMTMEVYGLVGNPVTHSLSPPMHEAAYDAVGMDAQYVTFEPATDRLAAAIRGGDALGIRGLNVTVPFKEAVLESVEPTALAAKIGAVNTIDYAGDGPPIGSNTDAVGAERALWSHDVTIRDAIAVVVGAGGAGRAIAWMLAENGASVRVVNRTTEKATALAADIGGTGHGLDAVESVLGDADILVNATTVGMGTDESPVPADRLHTDLTVFDAVYHPPETRLLTDAESVGATTVSGVDMLLHQAVAAFETWTGHDAPVTAMESALHDRL